MTNNVKAGMHAYDSIFFQISSAVLPTFFFSSLGYHKGGVQ